MSLPHSLLPSSTPLFALPLSLILYFPFPSADTSTTLIVLTHLMPQNSIGYNKEGELPQGRYSSFYVVTIPG